MRWLQVENFDSEGYAARFFSEQPYTRARQRTRELAAMRAAAEAQLQETVSSNYQPFLSAAARVGQVEGDIAALGASLRALKRSIQRLSEQDQVRQPPLHPTLSLSTLFVAPLFASRPLEAAGWSTMGSFLGTRRGMHHHAPPCWPPALL